MCSLSNNQDKWIRIRRKTIITRELKTLRETWTIPTNVSLDKRKFHLRIRLPKFLLLEFDRVRKSKITKSKFVSYRSTYASEIETWGHLGTRSSNFGVNINETQLLCYLTTCSLIQWQKQNTEIQVTIFNPKRQSLCRELDEINNCPESDSGKWWHIHILWMQIKPVLSSLNKKDPRMGRQLTSKDWKRRQERDSWKKIQSVKLATCHTNDTPVTKQHRPVRVKVLNYLKLLLYQAG